MVLKSMTINESYVRVSSVVGPQKRRLVMHVEDWHRFLQSLMVVDAGKKIIFSSKEGEKSCEIIIHNSGEGYINL